MAKFDDMNIQPGTGAVYEYDKQGGTSSPSQVTRKRSGAGEETGYVPSTSSAPSSNQAILDLLALVNVGEGVGIFQSRRYNNFNIKSIKAGEGIDVSANNDEILISASGIQQLPSLEVYFAEDAAFEADKRGKVIRVSADGTKLEFVDVSGSGSTFEIKGAAPTVEDLPETDNAEGDAWLVASHLYVYTNGEFVDGGEIVGPKGEDGAPGVGVPNGGTTGQVLAKTSNANGATAWVNPSAGPAPFTTFKGRFNYDSEGNASVDTVTLPTGWTLLSSDGYNLRFKTPRADVPFAVYFMGWNLDKFVQKVPVGGCNIVYPVANDTSVVLIENPTPQWTGAGLTDYADFYFVYFNA